MSRYILLLLFLATPLPQDDVKDALAHAEALYYEARFNESIQLLSHIDNVLGPEPERLQDKVNVKLHLALAHIGLNDAAAARSLLSELFALNPDYRLDDQAFSPKILALANEAKAEADQSRCMRVQTEAQRLLEGEDGVALLDLIRSKKGACAGLEMLEPLTAELLYKSGFDLYKRGDLSTALGRFRNVVELAPKHELAAQYIDLIESKQQVSADRLFFEWQKSFVAHDVVQASARYRELKPLNATVVKQMREEYRKAVSELVDLWKQACARGDAAKVDAIRLQAAETAPEPDIAEDLLAQMTKCESKGCLQMNSQQAMARLKTRVNPSFPASAVGRVAQNVRVQIRIDEKGDVAVAGMQGGTQSINDGIRTALEHWKFMPISDENGARCAESEIPMVIKPATP